MQRGRAQLRIRERSRGVVVMARILGSCVALALLLLLLLPFARDACHRFEISLKLEAVMEDRDRAPFREWNGDAASFSRSLYERCELVSARGATNCERY